jgi:uncharacterized RDD family membrane protein YckC
MMIAPIAFHSEMFAGVRTRRFFAWTLDACIVAILTFLIWIALAIATFGFALFVLPPLFPAVAVIYHALSVSGRARGTYGMRALDLEVVTYEFGARASFVQAAAQAILFYLSWAFPLLFLVTLVDGEKRYLHDILSGLVIIRRAR